jgi:undecaprenol kinase/diacylglycerol kinase (ATP)
MNKFFKGFTYASKGIVYAFSTQINFKFHTFSSILVLSIGLFFELNLIEWLWITTATGLVIVAEIFNTALEVLVDLVSPGQHPKAGIIKDLSSAAVLITAILAGIIGLCIFLPKFISYAS